MVCVGPPLLASAFRCRLAPKETLLAPVRTNPVALPTALKLTLQVVAELARKISGPLALVLPETTELETIIALLATVLKRASPPPPVPPAVPDAVLPKTVLFSTKSAP